MPKYTRPTVLTGITERISAPEGEVYVTVNETDQGDPIELFIRVGRAGGAVAAASEALSRVIGVGLRRGVPLHKYREQLEGISHDRSPTNESTDRALSMADAVARVVSNYLEGERDGEI